MCFTFCQNMTSYRGKKALSFVSEVSWRFLNSWALFPFCKQWSKKQSELHGNGWRVEAPSGDVEIDIIATAMQNCWTLTNVQKKMLPITSQSWWLSTAISPLSIYSLLFLSLERLEKAPSGQILQRPTVLVLYTHRMKYRETNKKIYLCHHLKPIPLWFYCI